MKRFYLIGFTLLLLFDTLAQISFKMAGSQALPVQASLAWVLRLAAEPWILGAIAGYIGAFFTWMALLKHAPIGPAFAASHLEVVSVLLLSVPIFGEHIGPGKALGAVLIVAGILCLAYDEDHAPET
ncbi:MAG: EamA family transporter [Rhodanobacteraceae bacterium]